MNTDKNVLIPLPLAKQIIELLEYWDVSKCDRAIIDDYGNILRSLNAKLQKLELRDAYAKLIAAGNEDDRHDARMNYLWLKGRLNDIATDGCIF